MRSSSFFQKKISIQNLFQNIQFETSFLGEKMASLKNHQNLFNQTESNQTVLTILHAVHEHD
jgi:hypothetical protein